MKKKQFLRLALYAMLSVTVLFAFASCGCSDKSKDKDSNTSSDSKGKTEVTYTNEDGKTREELNSDPENFYGTWVATSSYAENLYGHLVITINRDGTFDADVTDEQFSGTWEKTPTGIRYTSDLMEGEIFYGKKCKMVIEDMDLNVTLKKVDD